MKLVRCSCGYDVVDSGLGDVGTEIAVKIALPDVGYHWDQGHAVKVANAEVWTMVRQAAVAYARAQGIDVDAINVPLVPREQAQRHRDPFGLDSDAFVRMFREAMNRRARRGDW